MSRFYLTETDQRLMRLKKTFLWATVIGLSVSASATFPATSFAFQEFDPFGNEVDSGSGDSESAKSDAPKVTNALAQSLIRRETKTPEESFVFLETLVSLNEAPSAWYYIKRLGDSPLEEKEALEFVEKVGTGRLLAFTGHKDFPADKKAWFTGTSTNAFNYLTKPETINETVEGLLSDKQSVRRVSRRRLQASGHRIVFPVLNKVNELLESGDTEGLAKLRPGIFSASRSWNQTLADIASRSNSFLPSAIFASLSRPASVTSDGFLMGFGSEVASSDNSTLKSLYKNWQNRFRGDYGFVPTGQAAKVWVAKNRARAERIYDDFVARRNDRSRTGVHWIANVDDGKVEQQEVMNIFLAAKDLQYWRLIESKLANGSEKARLERDYVASLIRSEKIRDGLDRALSAGATEAISTLKEGSNNSEASPVSKMLDEAVDRQNWIVALGALQWLEKNPQNLSLKPNGRKSAAVIRCLGSSDPRVRTKAVQTILNSSTDAPFAGSSQFNQALTKVLKAPEDTQAIIASTHKSNSDHLTAAVRADGWKALEISPTNLIPAIQNNRLVFAIITDALGTERFVPTIDRVRTTASGKTLPIFLVVRPENEEKARKMFRVDRYDPLTEIISMDRAEIDLPVKIAKTIRQVGSHPIPQLLSQADRFLVMRKLAEWSEDPKKAKNLNFQMLGGVTRDLAFIPQIGVFAAKILAQHGNPKSQTALLDSASSQKVDPKVRSETAKAFRASVKKFGLLLTRSQLKEQYARQNASGTESPFSQQIHNSLLDTIEARHRKIKFEDLKPVPEAGT